MSSNAPPPTKRRTIPRGAFARFKDEPLVQTCFDDYRHKARAVNLLSLAELGGKAHASGDNASSVYACAVISRLETIMEETYEALVNGEPPAVMRNNAKAACALVLDALNETRMFPEELRDLIVAYV